MIHPLINKESSHYDNNGKSTIRDFEADENLSALISWARISAKKYEHPNRAAKGQVEGDKIKARTFRAYEAFLIGIIIDYPELQSTCALDVYRILNIELEY